MAGGVAGAEYVGDLLPDHEELSNSEAMKVAFRRWLATHTAPSTTTTTSDSPEREASEPAEREGRDLWPFSEGETEHIRESGRTIPPEEASEEPCTLPPAGWRCTRAAGHDGPCAAVEG